MSLPKITSPVFTVELPSNKRKVKFRPFTVKEEKLLLMASQSEDAESVNDTIKQILTNCFVEDVNIDDLAIFDVEYLFLQLRAKSVDNIVELKMKDDEDEKFYDIEVDLNDAIVEFNPEHTNKITLNDDVMLVMKYPSFSLIEKMSSLAEDDVVDVIGTSIDKVVNGEELLDLSDYGKDDIKSFIESFSSKNMRDIEKFFQTLPRLKLDVSYMTPNGPKTKEVVGLQSFFTS